MTPIRRKLPDTRASVTRKAAICGVECYITVGFFPDDPAKPGEIFVKASKTGSEVHGMLDAVATLASIALQYGVPWRTIHDHLRHTRFGLGSSAAPGDHSSLLDGIAEVADAMMRANASVQGVPFEESA